MNKTLIKCKQCGKICKIVKTIPYESDLTKAWFITDLGGKIEVEKVFNLIDTGLTTATYIDKCVGCGEEHVKIDILECEDWVADKVFEVKGQ